MAKVSIVDVAKAAEVSVSTVSLVLRKKGHISQATTDRVHQAMAELGYIYNQSAANLRSQKSNVIGLLFDRLESDFSIKILKCLIRELEKQGFIAMVKTGALTADALTLAVNELKTQHVAGIILVAAGSVDGGLTPVLSAAELPYQVMANQGGLGMSDLIVCDHYSDSLNLTRFLLDLGHVSTVLFGGELHDPVFGERANGYLEAYRERGIPARKAHIIYADTDLTGQRQRLEAALRSDNSISALLCHSPAAAMIGAQSVLKLGYGVGKDFILSQQKYVTCFQEVDRLSDGVMDLSYILLPLEEMAHHAVRQLLQRLDTPEPLPGRAFSGALIR